MEESEQARLDLYDVIEELTTTGKKELDAKLMKRLKSLCKSSESNLKHAYHVTMLQLDKEHSEIRYSAVQIIDELFQRSALFRELLVNDFHNFLELTVEVDLAQPLPPPKARAHELKLLTLKAIKRWNTEFGEFYKKLKLGYDYLGRVKKIDFNNLREQELAQDRLNQESERKREQLLLSQLHKAKTEYNEFNEDITACIKQANTCFQLLIPKDTIHDGAPNDEQVTEHSSKNDDCIDAAATTEDAPQYDNAIHGIDPKSYNLTVSIPSSKMIVPENDDSHDIIVTLRESYSEIKNRYLPLVLRWITTLSKSIDNERSTLEPIVGIKNELKEIVAKYNDLDIINNEDSDNDSFIDVPENAFDDYMPMAKGDPEQNKVSDSVSLPGSSKETNQEYTTRKDELLSKAPFVQYDSDLRYWGEKKLHITPIVKLDSLHRFWNSSEHDDEFIPKELEASLTMRAMTYSGKFEKVKWECRAPIGNGKLCKRQDREKCPFHGPIVARDICGNPVDEEAAEKDRKRLEAIALQQAQEIQADIAEQTGLNNLTQQKSKRLKISKLRYSRLTDLKRLSKGPRKRLERKVLTKTALQRIDSKQASMLKRRTQESFGSNWNYQITQ